MPTIPRKCILSKIHDQSVQGCRNHGCRGCSSKIKKKLNSYFVVQADVQQAEPEVFDTCTVHTNVDKPSQIGNNQSHADPVAQEELDNTATVDEDVDINSYTQDPTELETNVNKHHFINSDTQDVEWPDCEWIRTEKEFTWTVR